jgi:hypothetical protein
MCEQHAGMSRRNVFRAGAVTALGLAGLAVPAAAGATALAVAPPKGACGPLPEDPHFTGRTSAARTFDLAAAETSYNEWPVGTPASAIGVTNYTVSGTSVVLPVKSGDVATVLMYVASRFNGEVEALRSGQCWGYSYRKNVNNPSVWSNHASGTAIDLNAVLHPNGAKGTFTGSQVASIRSILSFCGDVVYWGGDYRGTTDEMHFEIDVPPGDPALGALVSRINGGSGTSGGQVAALRARANGRLVCAESGGGAALIANRTVVGPWETFTIVPRGGNTVALRAAANNRYVCAENGGASSLIANRTVVGPWETFQLVTNPDGSFSLLSMANNRYVCAENGGGASLIANRSAIGPWESFDLVR